jgi:hypothetical protein
MIVDASVDVRTQNVSPWFNRVRQMDADEEEIVAKMTGTVMVADLIADDATARARAMNPVQLVTNSSPNIKLGYQFNQKNLAKLQAAIAAIGSAGAATQFASLDSFLAARFVELKEGVDRRAAALTAAMVADEVNYDKFGIKLVGVTFGMPSDLKAALAGNRQWLAGNESTAKPLDDIRTILTLGRSKYGIVYDRITLSLSALQFIVTCDQVKNAAQSLLAVASASNLNLQALSALDQSALVGRMLGLTVEVDDAMFTEELADGTSSMSRYMPENYVILSSTADDNNSSSWDFANGIVTESLVDQISNGGHFSGPTRGPVMYVEGGMNPPNVTLWSVQRGFPRKHKDHVTARIKTS